MMSKFETFKMEEVSRDDIKAAWYNPRKINEESKRKLKKKIKTDGLVMPIIVNKTTMTVVSGHQRLSILDEIEKKTDYKLNVAMIEVDEKKEKELNIFLNNQSVMGEFDADLLADIIDSKDYDNIYDTLGFERADLDYFFSTSDKQPEFYKEPIKTEEQINKEIENIKALKAKYRENNKEENKLGITDRTIKNDNYMVTIVFNTNQEKQDFMKKIKEEENLKYLAFSRLKRYFYD